MENNEEFKRMVASIKALEQQLFHVDDKQLDQQGIDFYFLKYDILYHIIVLITMYLIQGREVERQIKEHFAQCVNVLAARQEALLKDLQATITKQSTYHNN
jgi:hypothetical protein